MSKPKSIDEIRESFQAFFESKGHTRVPSARLIPDNDPTLLFVNAGMVPFKDCFLGLEDRGYSRATSAQKSVRAGGKHNDLENVGFTARHHTFFEMLGNFSFGDYFKEEAIEFAWEYVTKVLCLPVEKIAVSVFKDDDEAAKIWHEKMGLPKEKIFRFGEADNFWSMGDTGPCGPCSEIFWDQGKEVDGERWLEFWNLVFMQYDRQPNGELVPLKSPCVDTGMGLERMAAVMQGAASNYDTDLLSGLISEIQKYCESRTGKKLSVEPGSFNESALRVIMDHLRSTSFLIADGVAPSNEGRGYVLRRILRRAVRFGKQLGLTQPFLHELYPALQLAMGSAYPELHQRASVVCEVLKQEEEKFFETLENGLGLLEKSLEDSSKGTLDAEVAFKLYDTYGFPLDLTELIAREKNLKVDTAGFEVLLKKQQERSRASWKGSGAQQMPLEVREWQGMKLHNEFLGYETAHAECHVKKLHRTAEHAWVLLSACPFYAEGGGEVSDTGVVRLPSGEELPVLDCQKAYEGAWVVLVQDTHSKLTENTKLLAQVDESRRAKIRANHTGTHLLHAALRKILGEHVQQAGSVVDSDRLRFDFSHSKSMTKEEIQRVEDDVNEKIQSSLKLDIKHLPIDEAKKLGAMALFGEKYSDVVRVVSVGADSSVGPASIELCGGLHVANTAEISLFKLVSETGVSAGTRRIEAVTGPGVANFYQSRLEEKEANEIRLIENLKQKEKEIERLKAQIARGASGLAATELSYKGIPLKFHVLEEADANILRQKSDHLRQTDSTFAHVLWAEPNIMVTADTSKLKFHSGAFLKELGNAFGAKGGGQDKSAQGKLSAPTGGVEAVLSWIKAAK